MHPLAIFILAGPVIGLIFLTSLAAHILLPWLAGWTKRRALAVSWAVWMVAAVALQLTLDSDIPFDLGTYVLELVIAAVGFLPAVPGLWLGAHLRRRRNAASRA